jgi:hypothetical protein
MVTMSPDARAQTPSSQGRRAPAPADRCRPEREEEACPACGSTMRLWANYYRCRTCGFKESCCF